MTDALQLALSKRTELAKIASKQLPRGLAYKFGPTTTLVCVIRGKVAEVKLDSGATATAVCASVLARYDPDYSSRLIPLAESDRGAFGYGGSIALLGVYPCDVLLPHPDGNLLLKIEWLVINDDGGRQRMPYAWEIGSEFQASYGISIIRDPSSTAGSHVRIGRHPQRFAIDEHRNVALAALNAPVSLEQHFVTDGKRVDELYPPTHSSITYDDFIAVLKSPRRASLDFLRALETEAKVSEDLPADYRELIFRFLASCEDAF